jgi:PPE-repeat protein
MLSAAAGWAGLGGELSAAAESFSSVTSGLAGGHWQGAAAAAMAAVATQYAQWLSAAAAHAQGAAAQANATATIFEAAKAAITHPMAVAANRMQLVSLVRSNLFGFNAPAIAAAEGAYESMWAQNVAALFGYHGAASAAVAQLTPWTQALQSLPAAATPGIGRLAQLVENNQAELASLRRINGSELAKTATLTQKSLTKAGEALMGTERTAAATAPLERVQLAARYVADAGLINAGTALHVGARTASFVPMVLGEDADILGGAGALHPPLQTGGAGSGLGDAAAYDRAQMATLQGANQYQFSAARAHTISDLTAAGAALRAGDVVGAARRVVDAALVDSGAVLQLAARTAAFVPMVAGADLDIFGDGAEILDISVQAPPPQPPP